MFTIGSSAEGIGTLAEKSLAKKIEKHRWGRAGAKGAMDEREKVETKLPVAVDPLEKKDGLNKLQ